MGRLDGKVALITGAARGQGETEARLFAREGARAVLTDVLVDAGQRVANSIRAGGGEVLFLPSRAESPGVQARDGQHGCLSGSHTAKTSCRYPQYSSILLI